MTGEKGREQGGNVGAYLLVVVGVGLLAVLIVTSFGRLGSAEPTAIPTSPAPVAADAPPAR